MKSGRIKSGIPWLLLYILLALISRSTYAHVPDGSGDRRQFYSYFTSTPPVINGCLTDKTTPEGTQGAHRAADSDEWKDAYARHMKMATSGGDSVSVTWFFMNDSDYLYVGFVANSNNLGNNQSINMVFDQGVGGGSHNDLLEGGGNGVNNGEFRVNCEPTNLDINEYSFNGTSWVQQNSGNEVFMALGNNFGISFMQSEWKIPLKPAEVIDDNHSYLNVNPADELGMNIFYSTSSKGTFYWEGTNNSMTDPALDNGWIDLKLGVKRDFVTFYGTYNANGNPTVDGNITGGTTPDDGWRGSYFRNIILTNFAGKTLNAILYGVDDATANYLYVGLKVFDNDNDANDSCVVYQEQSTDNTTSRNFILDNGRENALIANTTPYVASRDRYWSGGASGSWAADASGANQSAAGAWRNSYYEYEYRINRNAATDDIELSDGGRMGFHIRYHDAEDGTDYFWELSPNADRIQIDWNNNVYVATGWADMQLGAPYFQVVYPEDNSYLEGVTNVRIYAAKSAGDIDSASFFRKSNPSSVFKLTKIGSSNEWSGTWDVTSLPNGADTIVFMAYDGNITMERIVNVVIKNDASAADPSPSVAITSPAAGSNIGGIVTISFSANAAGGHTIDSTQISIDGGNFVPTSTLLSHTWNTTLLDDGSHTVRIRVVDDIGTDSLTAIYNYLVKNTPTIELVSPLDSTALSGKQIIRFNAATIGNSVIDSCEISVDNLVWHKTVSDSCDTVNTALYQDGYHLVNVRSYSSGKVAYATPLYLLFANTPAVVITSPRADSVIHGTFTVLFNASAVAPATIESTWISIDGATFRPTSTPLSDTINTAALTDGDHTIQLKVQDTDGKSALSTILKVVVQNVPSIVINSPAADARLSGTVVALFTATAVSPALIESTLISLDGGLFRATSTNLSDTIDTRLMAEGTHYFTIKVIDNNGKMTISAPRKFNINNLPIVTLSYPTAGIVLSGIDTARFTALPVLPSTIESTWISIDGGEWLPTTGAIFSVLNTVELIDGTHSLQIRARDNSGKTDYSSRINFISRNAPSVSITYPSAGQYVTGTVTVRFRCTTISPAQIDTVEVSINGGSYVSATTESTFVWNTALLNDLEHTIKIRVRDDKEKTGESEILLVKSDNRPPVISNAILNYGNYSAVSSSGRLTISAMVFDRESNLANSGVKLFVPSIGIDTLTMNDNGLSGDTIIGDHQFSATINPASITSGPVAYSITALDLLGNSVTVHDTFYFDAVPPQLSLSILPLAVSGNDNLNGYVYVDNIELSLRYNDLHSGIYSGSLTISDSNGIILFPESPVTLSLTDTILVKTVKLKEGTNLISVSVTDRAGNITTASSRLIYIPPKVTATIGNKGGVVTNPNGTSITIPQGALFEPASITIIRKERTELPEPEKSGVHLIGPAYEFGPDGLIFRSEVTLSFTYSNSDLDPDRDGLPNYSPTSLAVYFLENGKWTIAGDATTDTIQKRIEIKTNHFTIYAIGTRIEAAGKIKGYWTKNPILRSEQSTFVYELPEDGKVGLSLFDAAGDLVRILIPENTGRTAGSYSIKWDGNNGNNRYCGTGLYFYLFKISTDSENKVIKKPVAIINR